MAPQKQICIVVVGVLSEPLLMCLPCHPKAPLATHSSHSQLLLFSPSENYFCIISILLVFTKFLNPGTFGWVVTTLLFLYNTHKCTLLVCSPNKEKCIRDYLTFSYQFCHPHRISIVRILPWSVDFI